MGGGLKVHLAPVETQARAISEELEVPVVRLDPDIVAEPVKVRLDITIRRREEAFDLDGEMTLSGSLLCSRCLVPVPWQAREVLRLTLAAEQAGVLEDDMELAEQDLEVRYLTDDELDLDELAAEQILLALPMRVACRDECAGICPTCGGNRNVEDACRCEPEGDPRWEALRGFHSAGS